MFVWQDVQVWLACTDAPIDLGINGEGQGLTAGELNAQPGVRVAAKTGGIVARLAALAPAARRGKEQARQARYENPPQVLPARASKGHMDTPPCGLNVLKRGKAQTNIITCALRALYDARHALGIYFIRDSHEDRRWNSQRARRRTVAQANDLVWREPAQRCVNRMTATRRAQKGQTGLDAFPHCRRWPSHSATFPSVASGGPVTSTRIEPCLHHAISPAPRLSGTPVDRQSSRRSLSMTPSLTASIAQKIPGGKQRASTTRDV